MVELRFIYCPTIVQVSPSKDPGQTASSLNLSILYQQVRAMIASTFALFCKPDSRFIDRVARCVGDTRNKLVRLGSATQLALSECCQ
jgi:hypothetical protein